MTHPDPPTTVAAWLTPGARVAWLVRSDQLGYRGQRAVFATVARLTPTLVVLNDDSRWRLATLSRVGESGFGPTLVPADDPTIVRVDRDHRLGLARLDGSRQAEALALRWRRDKDDDAARELAALITSTLAAIDAIRAEDGAQ